MEKDFSCLYTFLEVGIDLEKLNFKLSELVSAVTNKVSE